jgi:MoaA/NifB/PqqE/SkfB family radical SAM enzyme
MNISITQRMALGMQHHQAGRLQDAAVLYASILEVDSGQHAARHNLGMVRLGLGEVGLALDLLERSLVDDDANPGWFQSLPAIGMTLYQQGYWEDAYTWLMRAVRSGVVDEQVSAALARVQPREYLEPEVFDPGTGRVLLRYAARESSTYVYAIDIAGTCNLRCPTCPVGNSLQTSRKKGFMTQDLFRNIVRKIRTDNVADAPEIFLFNWGEPLLHPQIGEFIETLHEAGLSSHLSTNLNIEAGLREVAKSNPTNIKISLSGFTPESYARTHVRGNLALVKSNMYRLRHYLDQYKANTRVWVGHHIYRSNQAEIPEVAALCRELGFEHHPIAAFFQPLERLIEIVEKRAPPHPILEELIEHPLSYIPRMQKTKSKSLDCELRFNQTTINFDGSVALCCSVYEDSNMLGANFLEHSHRALEAMKYGHPMCNTCFNNGLAYVPTDKNSV